MVRPMKCRTVSCNISAKYFKPQGVPLRELEEVVLSLDEVEAINLSDVENLQQVDAAMKMNISRQTFGNILNRAHKKIATAILQGKALRISTEQDEVPINLQYSKHDCPKNK